MGQSATGSFALGAIKNSLSGMYAERLVAGMVETIQNDLIKQTYELNRWPTDRMGTLEVEGIDTVDTETFSKLIQRAASVGLVEVDRALLNAVRKEIGIDPLPEDMPPQTDILSMSSSRAGDGMQTAGNGTSKTPSGEDTSSSNLENSA